MQIRRELTAASLQSDVQSMFELAGKKYRRHGKRWESIDGAPVFTVEGQYTARGWTEWTEGFRYGLFLLTGDALDDAELVDFGRQGTLRKMPPHLTHTGVHDHGFNTLSTYGNLLRLWNEGRFRQGDVWEQRCYEQAIAVSGAVQASRWAPTSEGLGYVYSFNGPQSLFIDTMRTTRIMSAAHQLGHVLKGEQDESISLLGRALQHGRVSSRHLIFHGDSDHLYDVRGRTAHEGLFNPVNGSFRARSSQQGYSPFTSWTRGLAWAILGFAEHLEFLQALTAEEVRTALPGWSKREAVTLYRETALAVADHYIDDVACADGITYWDEGAPGLTALGAWRERPSDPFNEHEPVDASASAIAAQGLIRLGNALGDRRGARYRQAGFSVAATLLSEPYLSTRVAHEGLLLHSVYHWPNRWDHVPAGATVTRGESSMWGDYHLLELGLLVKRMAEGGPYPVFWSR